MSSSSNSSVFDSGVTEKASSPSGLKEEEGSSKPSCCSRKRPRDEHKASSKPSSSSKKLMKSAENLSPPVDHFLVSERMIKEGLEKYSAMVLKSFDGIVDDVITLVLTLVNTAKNAISDVSDRAKPERAFGFDLSYARKWPSLSKEDAETLDLKWKAQMSMDMEAAESRAKLMLEEYRLRSSQFIHN